MVKFIFILLILFNSCLGQEHGVDPDGRLWVVLGGEFGYAKYYDDEQEPKFTVEVLPSVQQFKVVVEEKEKDKIKISPIVVPIVVDTVVKNVIETEEVLIFTAPYCGACKVMYPVVERLKVGKLRYRHINTQADPQTTSRFGITSIPSIIIHINGKVKKSWVGAISYETITNNLIPITHPITYPIAQPIQKPVNTKVNGKIENKRIVPIIKNGFYVIPSRRAGESFYLPEIYNPSLSGSHQSRQSLINHLIKDHKCNGGLNQLSDGQLNDLHDIYHSTEKPIIERSTQNSTSSVSEKILPRYINIPPHGQIDLATYIRTNNGSSCMCSMCLSIYPYQNAYREQQKRLNQQTKVEIDIGQEATPLELVRKGVALMDLNKDDFFCDIGCGDGRWLIEAVKSSGCQAIGIEYDKQLVELAKSKVTEAGLSGKIQIIKADARDVDYSKVTAFSVHLYDNLLTELKDDGVFDSARVVVAPYHEISGIG
ncbi:MAG: thioredoxin domain-containing protein, partial [bacterium]|nr:thioredoxin domain-containing protein [bacterium]